MASLAEMAGWFFGWLLRNSAHATVLVGVVLALDRSICRHLSPRWRYGLWLLVVARLVLPFAPGSSLSLFNLIDLAPDSIARVLLQVLGLPSPVPVPILDGPHPLTDTPPWFLGALALWFPGALILAALLWRDHQRLQLAIAGAPVGDSEALDLLTQSKAVMGVRRHVELVESSRITSPAIAGWWRPQLLLPVGLLPRLTPDETRFLFLHELAHVKRGDIALNWLLAAVQILHWFNPVVWFALRRLLTVREEVCDDLVLRRCFLGAAREYGLTLLRLLEECAPRRLLPAYAGVLDDANSLRQRVRSIRDFALTDSNPWVPAVLTVTIAVIGLTERPDHNVLSAPTPSYAEIHGHSRPALRGARNKSSRSTRPAGQRSAALLEQDRRPASSTPSDLAATLLAAVNQALAQHSLERSPAADPTSPASTSVRLAGSPSALATAAPGPSALASRPASASPTSASTAGTPLLQPPSALALANRRSTVPVPLVELDQAARFRRSGPPSTAPADSDFRLGRSPDVVPYFGRQASVIPVALRRPAG